MNVALRDSVEVYRKNLMANNRMAMYLKNRGIPTATLKYYRVGATMSPPNLFETLKNQYDPEYLVDSNLIYYQDGNYTDVLRNCIVIPMYDKQERVTTLTARKINNEDGNGKYRILPNTRILNYFGEQSLNPEKLKMFNYNKAAFICEGQFDTMSLASIGLVSLGIIGVNNMREELFTKLKGIFSDIVIAFDNDAAGHSASVQAAGYLANYLPNVQVWRVNIPRQYKDINSWLCGNPSKFTIETIVNNLQEIKEAPISFKKPNDIKTNPELALLKQIDLSRFVQEANPEVQFTKYGRTLRCQCVFSDHSETKGSFVIYTNNNSFYCYGCGRGGDIIKFCEDFYGMGFREAVLFLKSYYQRQETK